MPERNTGLRAILSSPKVYNLAMLMLGSKRTRRLLAERYFRVKEGEAVLDIGCGTAEILQVMPRVKYTGYDTNSQYIESCKERYPVHKFVHAPLPEGGNHEYDLVLAIGVLHHMDDDQCKDFFAAARRNLKPGGRVITLDNCKTRWQSPGTRFLFWLDRGQAIRFEPEFRALAESQFSNVRTYVVSDLMPPWIPYTHIIMEAVATPAGTPAPPLASNGIKTGGRLRTET